MIIYNYNCDWCQADIKEDFYEISKSNPIGYTGIIKNKLITRQMCQECMDKFTEYFKTWK